MALTRRWMIGGCVWAGAAWSQEPAPKRPPADLNESTFLPEVPVLPPLRPEQISGRFGSKRWVIQRMMDADETEFRLQDMQFSSPERGIVLGMERKKERVEPQAWLTRDGGAAWTSLKLKDTPLSVFMLDESRGYMVGEDSLWYTSEGGLQWEKRKLPKDNRAKPMFRVFFTSEKHGWALGGGKVFHWTVDGGLTWRKVPESEALTIKDENTVWSWMSAMGPEVLAIVGLSAAPPRDASRFPDWMMPERALRRNLTPSTTLLGQSRDGGKTWKVTTASLFGRVARLRTMGSRALVVYHYGDGIEFPSEVYEVSLATGKSVPFFRRKDAWVHDAVLLKDGGVILAAVEPPGRLRSSPIPGRLRIYYTPDSKLWFEMKVPYKATGRKVWISRADDDNIWAATDEGTILKLT
ncbi:MAG: hypothetical protein HY821_02290 [Acidobacteria bacterium]|nr:hypothetical protein [Acidobacteriota bacterium]